ncbi:hypothetical protein MnBA_37610 [Marinobacterium sp. BA1]
MIVQVVGGLAINSLTCTLTMSIVRKGCAYRAAYTGETVVAVIAEAQSTFTQYIATRVLYPYFPTWIYHVSAPKGHHISL